MSKNESKTGENQEKINQKIQKITKSVGSCVERARGKINTETLKKHNFSVFSQMLFCIVDKNAKKVIKPHFCVIQTRFIVTNSPQINKSISIYDT